MKDESPYKLKRISLSSQVAEYMKDKIISHEWKPGEKIPSENDLAKQFGISRLSARTALQRLAALGLVEIRVGDGTYIPEFPLNTFIEEGSELLLTIQMKDEISEFRDFFERSYMILACQRCTKKDIEKARLILDKMKQAANKGSFDEYIQYDIPFHRSLCEFSKNQYFILVFRLMEKAITEHLKDNTIAFSKLPSFSLNKKDDNFYLKQLVIGHQNYIVALEKHDASIAMQYLHPYLDIYKTNRHKTENNNF